LAWQITKGLGILNVDREFHFHPTRQFRFDIALPMYMLAIEIEGGIFLPKRKVGKFGAEVEGGRHNMPGGMKNDLVKYAEATCLGWRILRVLPEWVQSGVAFTLVERAVKGEGKG
jgi:hypothetical protein